jgi:hypothetical protein
MLQRTIERDVLEAEVGDREDSAETQKLRSPPSIGTMPLSHDKREPANDHPFLLAKLVLKVVLRVDEEPHGLFAEPGNVVDLKSQREENPSVLLPVVGVLQISQRDAHFLAEGVTQNGLNLRGRNVISAEQVLIEKSIGPSALFQNSTNGRAQSERVYARTFIDAYVSHASHKQIPPFLPEDDDVEERHVRQTSCSEGAARNVRNSDAADVLHVPDLEGDDSLESHLVRFVVDPPVRRREVILERERRQQSGRIHNLGGNILIDLMVGLWLPSLRSGWLRLWESCRRAPQQAKYESCGGKCLGHPVSPSVQVVMEVPLGKGSGARHELEWLAEKPSEWESQFKTPSGASVVNCWSDRSKAFDKNRL